MKNLYSVLVLLLFLASSAHAADLQSHEQIRQTALAYAQAQTAGLPGKVSIQIGEIDRRTALRTCSKLEAFLPTGSQLTGKTSIGVRCNEPSGWSLFLQATIRVSASLLVANRPLAQNTVLNAGDFSMQSGELGQPGILTDPAQAIGKTLKFAIGAGQVLRQDMLRAPYVVTQGQTVDILARGDGFSVRSTGQALNNGAEGQTVQVKVSSGQVVSGKALANGNIEVRP